jgi:peptide/nickel transport system substrate-binding protein
MLYDTQTMPMRPFTLLALGLCLSLMGLPARAASPDTYTSVNIRDFESIDPAWVYGFGEQIPANLYDKLVDYHGASVDRFDPMLSEKVPSKQNKLISADGMTYRFPIRKGVAFHDGSALTPEDVRYSLLRFMLMDRAGGPSAQLLEPILGVESTRAGGKLRPDILSRAQKAVSVDGDGVVIRLVKAFPPFVSVLAHTGYIQSKAWCVAHGSWDGTAAGLAAFNDLKQNPLDDLENGTGPYVLERWDKKTATLLLARNDRYWRPPAAFKRVVIKTLVDLNTRRMMLQGADADDSYLPQPMRALADGTPGTVVLGPFAGINMELLEFRMKINPTRNPDIGSGKLDGQGIPPDFFTDLEVRKAFACSLDYDAIVKDILKGQAAKARGILPETLFDYPKDTGYRFDLAEARAHLQKAWNGEAWKNGFRFILGYPSGNELRAGAAAMLKRNLEQLNPKIKIDVMPFLPGTILQHRGEKWSPIMMMTLSPDYPEAQSYVGDDYLEEMGYANKSLERLAAKAAAADGAERRRLIARYVDLFRDDVAVIPLVQTAGARWQRSDIAGYVFNPMFPGGPASSYYYDLRRISPTK